MEGGQTTHYLALGHKNLYEKTWTVVTKHIFAGSQRIAEVKDGVVTYYHNDHLGSPRAVTNASGTVIATTGTRPFGQPHSTNNPSDYLFTGKQLDDTGLYYFAARYYDPSVGRFVTQDTWEGELDTPATQNRYVYVLNNPLMLVDPTGENPVLGAIAGGAIGGAIGLWFGWKQTGKFWSWETWTYGGIGAAGGALVGAGLGVLAPAAAAKAATIAGGAGAAKEATIRVIGSYPEYVAKGKELGAKFFQIPIDIWNKMTPAEQWEANKTFLDRAITEGATFIIESARAVSEYGPGLRKEIEYLLRNGYELVENGTKLIKR